MEIAWHFFLQRTPGYGDSLTFKLLRLADIQRVDMGIAMCHFALTARELGLSGHWLVEDPAIARPDELTEYSVSWVDGSDHFGGCNDETSRSCRRQHRYR